MRGGGPSLPKALAGQPWFPDHEWFALGRSGPCPARYAGRLTEHRETGKPLCQIQRVRRIEGQCVGFLPDTLGTESVHQRSERRALNFEAYRIVEWLQILSSPLKVN